MGREDLFKEQSRTNNACASRKDFYRGKSFPWDVEPDAVFHV